MKYLSRLVVPGLLCLAVTPSFASSDDAFNNSSSDIKKYLLNLGSYLGFNLKTDPASASSAAAVSQTLLNLNSMQNILNLAMNSWFGSLLVNTAAGGQEQAFMPATVQNYSLFNGFANFTFKTPAYSSPTKDGVSVSALIDQQPYQTDPVSQALLNILSTPDYSYCLNNEGTAVASCTYGTQLINENQVMINAIGTVPNSNDYFAAKQVQPLLAQVNSNSLITPLMYTTTSNTANNPSSFFSSPIIGGNDDNKNQGLTAQSQAQQAANFVRYVTSAVMPMQKPNRTAYDNLYIKASNPSGNYSQLEQQQAAATLSYYLNNLRVYTAQSSVAISNLYYILSKRMPQNATSSGNNQPTSQALSEFSMATWRLYNPNNGNNQWLAQIDKASPTTVGKEIAALLAEMNYQLYLNRQIQERILLTNSIMILQNAQANQPNPSFDITANSVTNSPNSQ